MFHKKIVDVESKHPQLAEEVRHGTLPEANSDFEKAIVYLKDRERDDCPQAIAAE